jgi:hypothetical protein
MPQIEQAYEVEKLPGEVSVEICKIEHVAIPGKDGKTRPQIIRQTVKQPAGYMVYFPRGHSFRVATLEKLRELGLAPDGAPLVDMDTGQLLPKLSLKSRTQRA